MRSAISFEAPLFLSKSLEATLFVRLENAMEQCSPFVVSVVGHDQVVCLVAGNELVDHERGIVAERRSLGERVCPERVCRSPRNLGRRRCFTLRARGTKASPLRTRRRWIEVIPRSVYLVDTWSPTPGLG